MRTITLEEHYATAEPARTGRLARMRRASSNRSRPGRRPNRGDGRRGIDLACCHCGSRSRAAGRAEAVGLARDCNDGLQRRSRGIPIGWRALRPCPSARETRRRTNWNGRCATRFSRRGDQRAQPGPLWTILSSTRPQSRSGTEGSDLSAPDDPAEGCHRVQSRGIYRQGDIRAGDGGLGMAHQHRNARAADHSRRRVRPVPDVAHDHRAHG